MRHYLARKGLLHLAMVVGLMVVLQGLYAQTWTWQQQCSSNEWYATCSSNTICDPNNNRYWYLNNWGQFSCGSSSGLTFPGPGSTVIFPAGANARLAGSVDVLSITVANNANFTWQSGTITLRDPANNNAPGTLLNQGAFLTGSAYEQSLSGLLVNDGDFVHRGYLYLRDATLRNLAGKTLELQGGSVYAAPDSSSHRLENYGTLLKTGSGTSIVGVPMQQQAATVQVAQGALQLNANSEHQNVSWDVASGATLAFSSTHTFTGTHTGAIQGTLRSSGTLQAGGSSEVVFRFTDNGLTWQSGTLNGGSAGIRNTGKIVTGSAYEQSLSGLLVNDGDFVHRGYLYLRDATLRNLAGKTLELQGGSVYAASDSSSHRLENYGTLLKTGSGTTSTISVPMQNAGLIDYREGSLSINRLVQTDGETRIHAGRTLTLSNPMELQGGKLTGAGTLSGNLNVSDGDGNPDTPPGTIAPGIDDPNNPNLNPLGVLTLNGNLTMSQDAVLEIELAGTDNSDPNNPQYDQVRISRYNAAVQLDGTLRLKGRGGYTPNVGDAFDVVLRTASSWNRTGQFRVVEVDPDTLPCVEVAVRYLADRVRVEVVRSGDNPDTNGDGCVDDADLLNVLFAFGQTGSSPADVNCDGIVDDADLLSVLFAFGQGC